MFIVLLLIFLAVGVSIVCIGLLTLTTAAPPSVPDQAALYLKLNAPFERDRTASTSSARLGSSR